MKGQDTTCRRGCCWTPWAAWSVCAQNHGCRCHIGDPRHRPNYVPDRWVMHTCLQEHCLECLT